MDLSIYLCIFFWSDFVLAYLTLYFLISSYLSISFWPMTSELSRSCFKTPLCIKYRPLSNKKTPLIQQFLHISTCWYNDNRIWWGPAWIHTTCMSQVLGSAPLRRSGVSPRHAPPDSLSSHSVEPWCAQYRQSPMPCELQRDEALSHLQTLDGQCWLIVATLLVVKLWLIMIHYCYIIVYNS